MKLQEGLLKAEELQHYHAHICTESYPDLQHFVDNEEYIEDHCPAYSETSECTGAVKRWEAHKLGRVPGFVHKQPALEPAAYAKQFDTTLQYYMERCQHHLHPLRFSEKEKKKIRIVPNGCLGAHTGKRCKHEFPKTNRVRVTSDAVPLLICKGIAKQFKLKVSGIRNEYGQTLLPRNHEFINGCMPGLCIALGGSNSDIKLNDRLPIIAATHSASCKTERLCETQCML